MANNYTLGRGEIHFSRFLPNTQIPEGFRYIGNTPEFSLTIETENLDHYSSDRGIREKDDSVPLEVNRTGQLTTDNIVPANVSLFFFGTSQIVTQASVAAADYTITDVTPGLNYQLGYTEATPVGHRGINPTPVPTVEVASALKVLGTDYELDLETGYLRVLEGGSIVAGDDLTVNYAVLANSRERMISGSTPVEGAMRYIAFNPKGKNIDYTMPWVKITPNGDYALKGDEWQTIPFSIEVLKKSIGEAIYADGRPFTP